METTGSTPMTQAGCRQMMIASCSSSVLCLNQMAEVLGSPEDAVQWNASVDFPGLGHRLDNLWEMDTPAMFGGTGGGIGFSNLAPAANSMFPRDWVVTMAQEWMNDGVG